VGNPRSDAQVKFFLERYGAASAHWLKLWTERSINPARVSALAKGQFPIRLIERHSKITAKECTKNFMQQAKRADVQDQEPLYQKYINPQWVRLLEVLQMNVEYVRCEGAQLHTADGRHFLDYISGYCVHNAGHNHPRIIAALNFRQFLDRGVGTRPPCRQFHLSFRIAMRGRPS
jgi:hypothetical protein